MERAFHLKIYCKGSISLGQRSIVICIHWLTVAIQQRNEIPVTPAGISLPQQSNYLFHFAIVYGQKFWANDGMIVMPSLIAFLLYVFFVAAPYISKTFNVSLGANYFFTIGFAPSISSTVIPSLTNLGGSGGKQVKLGSLQTGFRGFDGSRFVTKR